MNSRELFEEQWLYEPPQYISPIELFLIVANGFDGSIVSDVTLTDKGLNIWRRLLSAGYPISVYDKTAPGALHTLIKTVNDFDQYFSNNPEYRKYRFIVSKNINEAIEVRAQFLTRRTRELAGMI